MVDIIVFILIAWFTISGLKKGIIRIILEFFLLCFCIFLGSLAYKITQNAIVWVATIAGSLLTAKIIVYVVAKIRKKRSLGHPSDVAFLNSMLGGVLGFVWGVAWCFVILFGISMIPKKVPYVSSIRERVEQSRSFNVIRTVLRGHKAASSLERLRQLSRVIDNPEELEKLAGQIDFKKFLENEKIKEVFSDEETQEQLQNKDIIKLMKNPKVMELLSDPELMREILRLDAMQPPDDGKPKSYKYE